MDEDIIGIIIALISLTCLVLSIAIPCLINSKMNIDKEIKLKQIELYGEEVEEDK